MYIDESGDTIPLSNKGKNNLVLTGCIIEEKNKFSIETRFREIKQRYYLDSDVEIKSNFLRYANPDIKYASPIKLNDRKKYDELEAEVASFLKEIQVSVISVVIDKAKYWQQFPAENPYHIAYILLAEKFQSFLEEQDSLGICIIDPREGQVEKSFIGLDLGKIHHRLIWVDDGSYKKCPSVIERLLFATSDKTIGIQIADLYCYPIFHIHEYNKDKRDYWRFNEIAEPKLLKYKNSKELSISVHP